MRQSNRRFALDQCSALERCSDLERRSGGHRAPGWAPHVAFRWTYRIVLLAVFTLLAGCAESASDDEGASDPFADGTVFVPGGGQPRGGVPRGGTPGSDATGFDATGGEKPDGLTAGDAGPGGSSDVTTGFAGLEIIFLHDTSKPIPLYPDEDVQLSVKVIDYATGGAAETVLLNWSIIDAVGPGAPGDAELSHESTYTGPSGQSNVLFSSYTAPQVLYTVEVSADGAVPRTIQVRVDERPTADLRVEMTYNGPVSLTSVQVRIMPSSFKCGQFVATNPPAGLAEKTVLSPTSQPVFTGLAADKQYTVFATAKGPSGSLAGAGCRDGVYVEAGIENVANLNLYVLVLNPSGKYDLHNIFDFTGAVPGQIGDVLDGLAQLFYNPGGFLVEQIKNLVKQFIPGFITDAIFGLFEKQLAKIITDWVLNDAPGWVQDFFTIGQDILQVVAKLQLTGTLSISKLQNDYFVEGGIAFSGVIFSWKLGCDKTAPDYEECGQYPFSLDDLGDDFPLDLLSGSWTGTISQLDKLQVDKHTLALNYGKLILFVLNDLILQTLTGEDNLIDAVAEMIGCDGIASSLGDLGLFDEDDILDACEGAVGLLVLPLESYLLGLETDSLVSLQGNAKLRDDNDDLLVDRIIDGVWTGFVVVGGASGNPFSGTWSALRQ